jgi:hypothetical protein
MNPMKHFHGFNFNTFILYLILTASTLAILSACYPNAHTSSRTLTPRVEQRNEAIRKEVRKDVKVGQRYLDYGFGTERVIKPVSFRRLDSLYAAYFEEEQKTGASRNVLMNLKNEIELEKSKVMADTVHFQYEKDHFFGITSGDSATIIHSKFLLDAQNTVIHVDIQYIFTVHQRLTLYYQAYIRRESFVDFGYAPSREEDQFYNFFDGVAMQLSNAETRGTFIGHMLNVMRAAQQQRGLSTEPLIKQHIINIITGNIKDYKPLKWSSVYTNLDENDVLISYEVDHSWTFRDNANMSHNMQRTFILNPYFEITEIYETDRVRD